MPLKLAVIAHPRFPIRSPFAGGLEAFTHAIVQEYKLKFDVTLYAHPSSDVNVNLRSFPINESFNEQYPELVENDFLLKVMKDIHQSDFDVIHNNAISSIPAVYACKNNIPLINTLHTPPYSKLKASTELTSCFPNVKYVAVSHMVAELWRPFINDSIDVIYNGINLSKWESRKTPKDFAFSFGRISPSKGFDLSCKAAKHLGMPIKIAGPVFDQHYFKTKIEPLLDENTHYIGHLSHSELREQLAMSKVAIFGTRWDEPFGLSTVEALATGTPVAAFNRGAFPEIVASSGGVLALGNNVDSLSEALASATEISSNDAVSRANRFPISRMSDAYKDAIEAIA